MKVYPRVCGGTHLRKPFLKRHHGLSPRLRGNRFEERCQQALIGSIPASAGEPCMKYLWKSLRAVYPRVCGGTAIQNSIPAQPLVYPRVCGGTTQVSAMKVKQDGLSPRLRGNLGSHNDGSVILGSIPASAGEPPPSRPHVPLLSVYPRVCGGTDVPVLPRQADVGLSPRLRGNH